MDFLRASLASADESNHILFFRYSSLLNQQGTTLASPLREAAIRGKYLFRIFVCMNCHKEN
jgi:hypothetical protein